MIAVDPPQDHGNTPTTMGFEQLLNLESTPPTMRPGGTEDKALSEQVIEGAFLFLEEAAKEAQLSRNKHTADDQQNITQELGNPQRQSHNGETL